MWLTRDTGPASTGSRTETRGLSGSGTIHLGTAGSSIRDDDGAPVDRAHFASLGDDSEFAFKEPDNQTALPLVRLPFGERFSFDQPASPGGSLQSSQPSAPFQDRFIGDVLASSFIGEVLAPSAPGWSAADQDPSR